MRSLLGEFLIMSWWILGTLGANLHGVGDAVRRRFVVLGWTEHSAVWIGGFNLRMPMWSTSLVCNLTIAPFD